MKKTFLERKGEKVKEVGRNLNAPHLNFHVRQEKGRYY